MVMPRSSFFERVRRFSFRCWYRKGLREPMWLPGLFPTKEPMRVQKNRGATIEVFANRENDEKMPNRLGTRAQHAVPFPKPLLLLEDTRILLQKRKLCPKNCAIREVHSCIQAVPQYSFTLGFFMPDTRRVISS